MSDEFRMFYSSGDAKGSDGIGVVLGPCVKDKVTSVHCVINLMVVLRLKGKNLVLVIVQIYMPHSGVADEEVEEIYDKIEEIVEKEKKGCVLS